MKKILVIIILIVSSVEVMVKLPVLLRAIDFIAKLPVK